MTGVYWHTVYNIKKKCLFCKSSSTQSIINEKENKNTVMYHLTSDYVQTEYIYLLPCLY